jgi:hypothetical protein
VPEDCGLWGKGDGIMDVIIPMLVMLILLIIFPIAVCTFVIFVWFLVGLSEMVCERISKFFEGDSE